MMIKISQYSVTNKRICIVMLLMPAIAIANYVPNLEEDWNLFGFLSIIVIGWLMGGVLLFFKTNRKKIIFTSNLIQIKDLFNATQEFSWVQLHEIGIDHRYLVKRYKIMFDSNFAILFEASKKTIEQVIKTCPSEKVKLQFRTLLDKD